MEGDNELRLAVLLRDFTNCQASSITRHDRTAELLQALLKEQTRFNSQAAEDLKALRQDVNSLAKRAVSRAPVRRKVSR